jgi:hypothetical protein
MAIKVKELKDDVIIDVKVNKTYYMMLKASLFFLFQNSSMTDAEREESLKNIAEKDYPELNEYEKTFQTITRIIGEIEKIATENDMYEEKEILEPADEGYVTPTQD